MIYKTEDETISVIIPVYNSEKYLHRCINSVLNQTYRNLQIILVDDGSQDNSGVICDMYRKQDARIEVIHKVNGGAGAARNAGLEQAQGAYIAFVDADDWIDRKLFAELFYCLVKYNADISLCDYREHYFKTSLTFESKQSKSHVKVMDKRDMMNFFFRLNGEKSNYSVCGKLIKRTILQDFRFIEGRINEDIDACYHFFTQANTGVMTDKKMYHYFQNINSVTLQKFSNKDFDLLYVWDRIIEHTFDELPQYVEYALLNRKRADFTLLVKIERDYFRGHKELKNICKKYQKKVRRNIKELLRWKMSFTRKILLIVSCYMPVWR